MATNQLHSAMVFTALLHTTWSMTVNLLLQLAITNKDHQTLLHELFPVPLTVVGKRHFLYLDHNCGTLPFDLS